MEAVRRKLQECGLSVGGSIKQFDFAQRLEKFVKNVWNDGLQEGQECGNLRIAIQSLEKNSQNLIEKRCVRLFLVDSIINNSSPTIINDQFTKFLDTLCEQVPSKTESLKTPQLPRTTKSRSFLDKFSPSLSTIRSLIKIDYFINRQEQHKKNNNTLHSPQQSSLTLTNISQKILSEYNTYLRKKLLNYKLFINASPQSKSIESSDHLLQLRSYAWKIINLFTHHTVIVNLYKKIAFIQRERVNPLIIITLNILCQDCLVLYAYISKLIGLESQCIKRKYDRIVAESGCVVWGKDIMRLKLMELKRDVMLVDVSNLLCELNKINTTIVFLFCGTSHCRYIHVMVPSNYFLKTSNPALDDIHHILNEVKRIDQKQQRLKQNRNQISLKLDKSVSRILSNPYNTIQTIKPTQSEYLQSKNHAECEQMTEDL